MELVKRRGGDVYLAYYWSVLDEGVAMAVCFMVFVGKCNGCREEGVSV